MNTQYKLNMYQLCIDTQIIIRDICGLIKYKT